MTRTTGDDDNSDEEEPEDYTSTMKREDERHKLFTENPPIPKPRKG